MAVIVENRVNASLLDGFLNKLYPEVIRRVAFYDENLISQYPEVEAPPYKPILDNILLVNALDLANISFCLFEGVEDMLKGTTCSATIRGEVIAVEERGPTSSKVIVFEDGCPSYFYLGKKCYSFLVAIDTEYLDAIENYDKGIYIARAWFLEDEIEDLLGDIGLTLKDLFEKNFTGPLILRGDLSLTLTEQVDIRLKYTLQSGWRNGSHKPNRTL